MKYQRKRGSTSNMLRVFIQDNTATDGTGLTGLVFNSTNLQISVIREFDSTPTIYTGANIENITTIGTFQAPSTSSKCRFKVVDGTNMPGMYEIHFHDDAGHFGAGDASKNLQIYVFEITTTNLDIAPNPSEIQLTAIDLEDAVRFGLTALPNAVAEAAGGLYTRGSGAGQINQAANGQTDSNVARWLNTAVTADTAGHPKVTIKDGSGQGELLTTSGKIDEVSTLTGHTPQSGDGYAITNSATFGNAKLVRATTPANTLDIDGSGEVTAENMRGTDGANTTKTGFSLSTAGILAIWHQLTAAIVTASTIGKLIVDFLNAAVSSRAVAGDNMNLVDDAITPAKYNDVAAYIPYAGGIWIDSSAANVNTVVGVDGLPSNPVSTLTAARTLADAIGIKKYFIVNDSTLTVAAAHLNWEFIGIGLRNQLDLGGQNPGDSYFEHLVLSGTQGGTQKIETACCYLNGIIDLKIIAKFCWLTATNTLAIGTLNILDHCSSNVPGGSTPGLTFQAGVTSIGIRHYSGGLQLNNMTSDHTVSYEADGQLIIDASCVSGNINARGNIKITDNGTTTNLTDEAVYNQSNVNAQVDNALNTAIPGSPTADSINEVLQDQAKAASTFVTGKAVAGTLSTTEMTCDLTEVTDDHYNGQVLKWTTGVLKNQATSVTDYDGASTPKKLIYVAVTEAPSIDDEFVIG